VDDFQRVQDSAFLWNHQHGRWHDLVWLVYSVFFFIEPLQRYNLRQWLDFALIYTVFLALYIGIIRASSPKLAYACMAGMTILGLAWYPFNQSGSGILVYVAAFAPFIADSLAVCLSIFAVVMVSISVEGLLLHVTPWSWGCVAFFSLAVGTGNLFGAQRIRANKRLSMAQEEIAHLAKVAERERIARALHDVLGHTLSVVVLKSELAGKLMHHNPVRAQQEIGEVEQIARKALAEVREAIRGYRSEGLPAEIDRARATLAIAGVTLDCTNTPPKLRPAEESVLSLVLREAVTNIVRHARATSCRMTFAEDGTARSLVLEDDGCGGIRHEGNGLRGMRERIESLGGRLHVTSSTGPRLTINVPAIEIPESVPSDGAVPNPTRTSGAGDLAHNPHGTP
jgi:two-component system sensor histidine kinase DesK